MRKVVSALLILTLILLFAATYVCSSKTETVFAEQVAEINQLYPGLIKLELSDYQRGFLLSTARTRVDLRGEQLELSHQIRHLPWKVQIYTSFSEGSELAERPQLQTDVSLQGAVESRLGLPLLAVAADDTEVRLEGLQFSCRLQPGLTDGDVSLQLTELTLIERGNGELHLGDLDLQSTISDQQGLMIGAGKMSLGSLQVQAEEQSFALEGVRYTVENTLQGEAVAGAFELSLDRLQLADEEFNNGRLRMRIAGLDAETLREMQQSARDLQQQFASGQSDPLMLQLQLFALYGQLFQQGLILSIEQLELQSDEGAATGKGEFALAQGDVSGLMAFEQLNGDFQLQLDQTFFSAGFRMLDRLQSSVVRNRAVLNEQAEQLAGAFVQKGILQQTDSGYRLDFAVRQGQPLLNGQVLR
ncbi:Uncharacterized conserved protein YdgA, DUF945 family [Malonomonas rubra DSM 5091]|uniref:Uncharacterized conserved protein YdgA, DUF945 family n=1 Tax=Malonomonas rubra DSM 5091 TaxID=1122189 RepID=A0A1M6IYQ7_MALRU|nr:DUF945 family protein [Malonomonas rubra]SHJ39566.1 Uncharacterized conserved protein YdgA, DUF945 family [Malonomonas rubra DSM 5091]